MREHLEELKLGGRPMTKLEKANKEIERLRNALDYVLEQVYGAMTKNWCIDWNFTDIRETFNIPNRFDEEEPYNTYEEQQDYLWEQIDENNIELGE